jgi:hypothetical protein
LNHLSDSMGIPYDSFRSENALVPNSLAKRRPQER